MHKAILATAAALTMAAVPAIAEDGAPDMTNYYHSLGSDQQAAFAYMTADQRLAMWQAERKGAADESWNAIVSKVNASKAAGETLAWATTRGTRDAMTQMAFISQPVIQQVQMADASDSYPVCRSDLDDHCMNPWAAGLRGPGVNRPLAYWPGEPASEMRSGG